ncbi:hypothetical protein OG612_45580 (plasmid) [Streptomyces sp. NBC_01527]|uniref:hypothetical protein n=1 Tax=Streptomyces sp. NBC_01527 TaxID=2903894 RepID=UPI002F912E3B
MYMDGAPHMARRLRKIGVEAQVANTGSDFWAAVVNLSGQHHLEVTRPEGEGWSWTLHRDGEQIMAGHWPNAGPKKVARHVKRLKKSLGSIVG